MSKSPTMLLVGAGGFVGGHLLGAAQETGLEVVAVGREPGAGGLACDLLDPLTVSVCLERVQPDLIVNVAGAVSVERSWERPAATFAVNAAGVLNLLEAVARLAPAAHVLCLSSADVYGVRGTEELPLRETLEPLPVTPYGASKAAMEILCGQHLRGLGLRVAIVRAFNLIGPGQARSLAVPGFAHRIVEAERAAGTRIELALGNPGAVRDFLDVRDAAAALVEISRRQLCGTYNLCSGRGTTIAGLVEELAAQTPVRVDVRQDPELARPADPPALVGDPRRLHDATGFAPQTPLAASLAGLLDHWRARPASA